MGSTISDGPASDTELGFIVIIFFVDITKQKVSCLVVCWFAEHG